MCSYFFFFLYFCTAVIIYAYITPDLGCVGRVLRDEHGDGDVDP